MLTYDLIIDGIAPAPALALALAVGFLREWAGGSVAWGGCF